MFQQDGQLNENSNNNNTELSIDTVDIAPFRYRSEITKPVVPLLNSSTTVNTSVTSDKNGKFESSSVTIGRPPITIIKKGAAMSPRSSGDQNEYQSIKSTNKTIPEENNRFDSFPTELKKASFTNSNRNSFNTPNETTQTKVIYAQSSSKTLGQILPNDYDALTYSSLTNSNIINVLTPKSTETVTSSSNDYSDYEESSGNYMNNVNSNSINMDSNGNYSNDSTNYTQVYGTNMIGPIDRSQTMPSKKLIPNY